MSKNKNRSNPVPTDESPTEETTEETTTPKSKTKLYAAIAAGGALLVAGGAWLAKAALTGEDDFADEDEDESEFSILDDPVTTDEV